MSVLRTEHGFCRWCGRACLFQVQLTIDGAAAYTTDQCCTAAERVTCQRTTIDLTPKSKHSRRSRGKR